LKVFLICQFFPWLDFDPKWFGNVWNVCQEFVAMREYKQEVAQIEPQSVEQRNRHFVRGWLVGWLVGWLLQFIGPMMS